MKPGVVVDVVVPLSVMLLTSIVLFIWGAATGIDAGHSQACSALCGDNWKWQDRCVCLEVKDAK